MVLLEAVQRSGLSDSTTILIVGDHGMITMQHAIKPNLWIKGLKAKFQTAGGGCFLYLEQPRDEATLTAVRDRLKDLPRKYRKLFKIYDKAKLVSMGADRDASLALVAKDGFVFSGSDSGEALISVKGGHHGYDPNNPKMYTGFIAAGAGIKKGGVIEKMNVCDVAAIVAERLKVDLKTMKGRVPDGLLAH